MSKFIIECPECGKYVEGSTGLFAKKKINCACGHVINIRAERMASRTCPHCGNNVVFDQSKGDKAVCPICRKKINTAETAFNTVNFSCPSCSCSLYANKNAASYTCPLCETVIDVQMQAEKEKVKNQGLASVIKYEGGSNTLVFRHPIEDFNLGSQLIVHESQEAIFFRDGQALDLFGAGRYTLSTQNLPILENLYKLPTNADTPFHSEVYFINMSTRMGVKWGTGDKIRMFEPSSGLHIELGASGQFNLRVTDSRKLLVKLVGTTSELKVESTEDINGTAYGMDTVVSRFKTMLNTKFRSAFPRAIKRQNINVLIIDECLDEISEAVRKEINVDFAEYGLTMPEFYISTVVFPDDVNFQRYKQQFGAQFIAEREAQIRKGITEANLEADIAEKEERARVGYAEAEGKAKIDILNTEAAAKMEILKAQAEAEKQKTIGLAEVEVQAAGARNVGIAEAEAMRAKGYNEKDKMSYEVQRTMAESIGNIGSGGGTNGGAGGIVGDMMSLGVGLGAAGTVIPQVTDMFKNTMSQMQNDPNASTWNCQCGNRGITGNFCGNCGTKRPVLPILGTVPAEIRA